MSCNMQTRLSLHEINIVWDISSEMHRKPAQSLEYLASFCCWVTHSTHYTCLLYTGGKVVLRKTLVWQAHLPAFRYYYTHTNKFYKIRHVFSSDKINNTNNSNNSSFWLRWTKWTCLDVWLMLFIVVMCTYIYTDNIHNFFFLVVALQIHHYVITSFI